PGSRQAGGRRVHQARADAVDPNGHGVTQRRQAGGEPDHTRLGHRVLGRVVAGRAQPRGRGDVDDRAAAALVHRGQDELRGEHDCAQVQVECLLPLRRIRRREAWLLDAPGVVDQHPDRTGRVDRRADVGRVGAEARAAMLASRSIKTTAKQWALDLAISMIDLTTLEGQDTPGKVRALCAKAKRPDPADPTAPMVAAVCVYPDLAHVAAVELKGSGVHVASVATAFPSGRTSLEVKLADVKYAVSAGADEVDMVIDRGAFLAGDYQLVFDEIAAVKDACGEAHLKVILETGELVTLDNV